MQRGRSTDQQWLRSSAARGKCQGTQGNPIEIDTGRKLQTFVDWQSGGDHPLEFIRFYSSNYAVTATTNSYVGITTEPGYSRFGRGWRSNFDSRAAFVTSLGNSTDPAAPTNGSRAHFTMPDSSEYAFRYNSTLSKWVLVQPSFASNGVLVWTLARTDVDASLAVANGYFNLTVPGGTIYRYDYSGNLRVIQNIDGYAVTLSYNDSFNSTVTDSLGRTLTFEYYDDGSLMGFLKSMTTPDGKLYQYSYVSRAIGPTGSPIDAVHSEYALEQVIFPDATPAVATDNPRLIYRYLADRQFSYALTGITDERGVDFATFAYDSKGRAISSQHAGGADLTTFVFDDVNNKVTVTNPLTRQTVYTFNATQQFNRRLTQVDGISTANCAASNTTYAYDSNGFKSQETDAEGRITKFTNNTRGLPTAITEGFGTAEARTTNVAWDATKPRPTQITAPGLTTAITYTTGGHVSQVTRTDTTTQTVPYSTNGQTRVWTYSYLSLSPPAPPPIGPTGTALSDVSLTLTNPDAQTGTTAGWTNSTGGLGVRTSTPCTTANACFTGGTSALTIAYQDISVPSGNIAEVDAGQRAARIAWRQNSLNVTDGAGVRLLFLNASGMAISSAVPAITAPARWTARQAMAPVPAGTRTIRVQMIMSRVDGSANDGYVDDLALTLIADGPASSLPFVSVTNPDALSLSTTGWTVSGSIGTSNAAPCNGYPCFRAGATGSSSMSQAVSFTSDRNTEIDAASRTLELAWVQISSADYYSVKAEIEFLDSSGAIIGAPAYGYQAGPASWTERTFDADIPAGARSARITLIATQSPLTTAATASFTGITARLIGRPQAGSAYEALASIDGPLSGTSDTLTYAYDDAGNVDEVTDEAGLVTEITSHDPAGRPLTVVDANSVTSALAYDEMGRLATVTVAPGSGEAVTSFGYDAAGEIASVARPDGSTLSYTYDDAKRLTRIENNAGEAIELAYDANGDVTSRKIKTAGGAIVLQESQAFDELGRLLRAIGAAAQTTLFGYDRTDLNTSVTDPRSNLYSLAYDALSRLIRETDQVSAQVNYTLDKQDKVVGYSDPRSLITSYVRNGFGDAIQEASPDAGTTVYVRDARGLVTQSTDGRSVVANFAYDAAGRLTSESFPAASGDTVALGYDATASGNKGKGRLTSIADPTGTTSLVYDGRGDVVTDARAIGSQSYAAAYGWTLADRLDSITYPSGRIVTYTRNALGQVTAVTTKQNSSASAQTVASGIAYMPMSELVSAMTFGNGLVLSETYDSDYRLSAQSLVNGSTTVLSLAYAYGDGINLTAVTDNVTSANSQGFTYTAANRLSQATGPWGTLSWTYDGVGNRLTETLGSTSDSYNYPSASNRLTGLTRSSTTIRSFGYDGGGNISSDTQGTDVLAFAYDSRNRPVSVTKNASPWASYSYNGLEQLASRSTSAPSGPVGTVHYIYDLDGHLLAEADALTGATMREYLWLADRPLAIVDGVSTTPVLYYVHTDHLDRPIRVTDSTGSTVWQAAWRPFGEPHSLSGAIGLDARFPGQWFQIETGLAYNWHRHYDALTGRYTQPDPLGLIAGKSLYGYAYASPLMFTDRDGQCPLCVAFALGALIGTGYEYWTNHDCATWRDYLTAALEGGLFGVGGELIGGAIIAGIGSRYGAAFLADELGGAASVAGGRGFGSFSTLKNYMGSAGPGNVWHHIVEQSQIGRFGAAAIHNTNNVVAMSEATNTALNALYSSIRPRITGSATQTVRQWLSSKSYSEAREFGARAINNVLNGTWP